MGDYPASLEALCRTFERHGSGLAVGTPEALDSILPHDPLEHWLMGWSKAFKSKYPWRVCHPLGPYTISTTAAHPSILYDDGAAFCTQILAFDREGNALGIHDSFIGDTDDVMRSKLAKYRNAVARIVAPERLIVVTGTNTWYEQRDDYLASVENCFVGEELQFIVAKQSPAHSIYAELPFEQVRGFLFVPRQLSKTGGNEYLIVNDSLARYIREHYGISESGGEPRPDTV